MSYRQTWIQDKLSAWKKSVSIRVHSWFNFILLPGIAATKASQRVPMDFKQYFERSWQVFTAFLSSILINTLMVAGVSIITLGL